MAKDLRSRMVLDLGPFRDSLTKAEKDYRKTVAELEKTSGVGINKMRLDLGSNAREFQQAQREAMGIRGGPDDRYSGMFGATARRAAEYEALNRQRAMGLESTVKLAAQAAAAITVLDVATKAWSGDIVAAADTVKQLPFGLGQVAKSIESVLGSWTGMTAEIEANNAEAKRIEETSIRINARIRERIALEKEVGDRIRETWKEAGRVRMDPFVAGMFDLADRERAEIERAKKAQDNLTGYLPSSQAKWEEQYQREVAAIQAKYRALNQKLNNEDADRRMADAQKEQDKRLELEREAAAKREVIQREAERRGRAMMDLAVEREAIDLERKRQNQYTPFGGNAALESQTLTRVPGVGNKTITEDPALIAEARTMSAILRNVARQLGRNQMAAAEL